MSDIDTLIARLTALHELTSAAPPRINLLRLKWEHDCSAAMDTLRNALPGLIELVRDTQKYIEIMRNNSCLDCYDPGEARYSTDTEAIAARITAAMEGK
jgi:hypothetical protein